MSRTATAPLLDSMVLSHADPSRPEMRGSRSSSTSRRSPTSATSTLMFLLISAGIDLDVNLLRLERIGASGAGDAIVEAHAAGDEKVSFLDGVVDPRFAVHAHHAQVERMRRREAAEAKQRESHGNLRALGERADLLHRARFCNAVASENHRPFGSCESVRRLVAGRTLQRATSDGDDTRAAWLLQSQRSLCPVAHPW